MSEAWVIFTFGTIWGALIGLATGLLLGAKR